MSAPDYDRAWSRGMAADLNSFLNAQRDAERNPLRTPDLAGPTQQFGAYRPVPQDKVPLVDSALAERGKEVLINAVNWQLTEEDIEDGAEYFARCQEAHAVPEVAAMHAYCYGLWLGGEDGRRQGEDERLRLRERVAELERENYHYASDPLSPAGRAHVEGLKDIIRERDIEIDRLRRTSGRSWPTRLLALWAALAGWVSR